MVGVAKSNNQASRVKYTAFPMIAFTPCPSSFTRNLIISKNAMSNANTANAAAPANPQKQELQQSAMGTQVKARSANANGMTAMPNATTCRTRTFVRVVTTAFAKTGGSVPLINWEASERIVSVQCMVVRC